MNGLSGKTILLTGGSSGIGAATVRVLAARAGAEQAVATLPPERRMLIEADFAEPDGATRLLHDALAWAGQIDAVVLNAAITCMSGGVEDSDEAWRDAWDAQWRINVLGPCDLMRLAVHHWLVAGGASSSRCASRKQRASSRPPTRRRGPTSRPSSLCLSVASQRWRRA